MPDPGPDEYVEDDEDDVGKELNQEELGPEEVADYVGRVPTEGGGVDGGGRRVNGLVVDLEEEGETTLKPQREMP